MESKPQLPITYTPLSKALVWYSNCIRSRNWMKSHKGKPRPGFRDSDNQWMNAKTEISFLPEARHRCPGSELRFLRRLWPRIHHKTCTVRTKRAEHRVRVAGMKPMWRPVRWRTYRSHAVENHQALLAHDGQRFLDRHISNDDFDVRPQLWHRWQKRRSSRNDPWPPSESDTNCKLIKP